jgi:outer membrane protein assembly factor BamA
MFTRIDASLVLRRIERETDFSSFTVNTIKSTLGSTFLTYAMDNTLWTIGGPLTGTRFYVTGGNTLDFEGKGFESTSLIFDARKYFKITNRILLAERFITRNSWGGDLQLFYLGGPWDLRGYDFRRFVGRSTYLLNSELRFPLVDRLNLYLPFGTIEFPMLRGSLFFDLGKTDRYILDTDWLGSFGAGVELNLGFAPVIRLNFTRTTDFSIISDNTEVELFIGLNY